MTPYAIALAIIGWLTCSFFAYGISFAYFQRKYSIIADESYRQDIGFCLLWALTGGPVALFVELFYSGFAKYGFKLF